MIVQRETDRVRLFNQVRTDATLAGQVSFSNAGIAKCLDHAVVRDDDGEKVGRVTGMYVQAKRMQQKRGLRHRSGA